jgi:signal transduction histidine kinase
MNRIGWLLRLALGAGLVAFLKVYGHSPLDLVMLAAVLGLELRCAALPAFSVFSANVALLLGLTLGAAVDKEIALGISALALLLRLVYFQRWRSGPGVWESLADGAALGLCLGFLPARPALISWVVAPLAHCLLAQVFRFPISLSLDPTARVGWERANRSLWSVQLVTALTATVVAVLSQWHSFAWLLLVPGLALLQELVQERLSLNRARRELSLLEKLSQDAAATPSVGQCFQVALRVLSSSFACQSAVFFQGSSQNPSTLRALAYQTPFAHRLESGLEPLVGRAFRLGEPVLYTGPSESRVFEGEEVAVALPLGDQGVLYVGRPQGPFLLEEHQFLVGFAQRVSLALLLGQQRQAREKELQAAHQARAALEQEVGWMACLLEGSRKFSASLVSHDLLSELQTLLQANLPHEAGEVWLDPSGPECGWGSAAIGAAREILSSVVTSGKPLRVHQLAESPFGESAEGYASALCVPIASESQVHGGILLVARRPQAFSMEQQQLLWALAYSLGAALTNARFYSDVVQARQELEKYQVQLVYASKLNAIGEVAAGVAHEINSPLGAVVMSLELVENQLAPDQAKSRERLQRALHSLAQARDIVSKLMVYGQQTSGQLESLSLAELVHDTYRLFGATWSEPGVEVLREVPPEVRARCKRVEMQQILVHLVKNASRACAGLPPERSKVRISARLVESGAVLEVTDAGCGISADDLERIFEPFVTGATPGQGGGLGLALCKQLAASTQGRLVVQSKVAEGSRFSVILAGA